MILVIMILVIMTHTAAHLTAGGRGHGTAAHTQLQVPWCMQLGGAYPQKAQTAPTAAARVHSWWQALNATHLFMWKPCACSWLTLVLWYPAGAICTGQSVGLDAAQCNGWQAKRQVPVGRPGLHAGAPERTPAVVVSITTLRLPARAATSPRCVYMLIYLCHLSLLMCTV